MWLFFSSYIIQVNLLLELLVVAFAITSLSKWNSSGIISKSRYQLVSRWIIDFVYIWVSDKFSYSDPQQSSSSHASRIHDKKEVPWKFDYFAIPLYDSLQQSWLTSVRICSAAFSSTADARVDLPWLSLSTSDSKVEMCSFRSKIESKGTKSSNKFYSALANYKVTQIFKSRHSLG